MRYVRTNENVNENEMILVAQSFKVDGVYL